MKISIYDFIHRGFFPKELPPPFNAYHLAVEYDKVQVEWNAIQSNPDSRMTKNSGETDDDFRERKMFFKNPVSVPAVYSISKGRVCRRNLAVLNPVSFLPLAVYIDTNIADITKKAGCSVFSQSVPTYDTDIHSRCYRASSGSVMALMRKKLSCARSKRVEVKVDISNFYSSIYTHSIVWAMIGKDKAKALWKKYGNRPVPTPASDDERMYNIGYLLDEYIGHCQDKQTSGIPVGPDSSFIVAELLAVYVDKKINAQFPDVRGCRYYDDYTLYVSTREEAASLVRYVQSVLNELELSVNEDKIEIAEAPLPFLDDFAGELSPFDFDAGKAETVLVCYFNLLWKLCSLHPNRLSTIIKYGLKPLGNSSLRIDARLKDLFESLLYKTALLDPSSLDLIQLLLTNKRITPTKASLGELTDEIINYHAPLSHHHEVAWALWFCKKYGLTVGKERVMQVFDMCNPVCTLMVLDYVNSHVAAALNIDVDVVSRIQQIETMATPEDLFGENWILLYEGAFHGWLSTTAVVNANPYFKYLLSNGISFYDDNNNADYQSYDYIETLPYDNIPAEMRKNAKDMRRSVFEKVYDKLYEDLEPDGEQTEDDINDVKSAYKKIIKDQKLENDVFEKILSELFRRKEPELDDYVGKVIDRVMEMMWY